MDLAGEDDQQSHAGAAEDRTGQAERDAILGAELLSHLNLHFDFPAGVLAIDAKAAR